jgi:hypothetical protein
MLLKFNTNISICFKYFWLNVDVCTKFYALRQLSVKILIWWSLWWAFIFVFICICIGVLNMYFRCRQVKSHAAVVLMNLCLALITANLLFICGVDKVQPKVSVAASAEKNPLYNRRCWVCIFYIVTICCCV